MILLALSKIYAQIAQYQQQQQQSFLLYDFIFILIIRNKMGCGALCGDTTTADSIINHHSKQALAKLIAQLQQNKQLISTHAYSSFFQDYERQPRLFQIQNKPKLIKDEQISSSLLIKWKLLLLGLDKNDKIYSECVSLKNHQVLSLEENKQKDPSSILFHECFIQIEKDITRTFDVATQQNTRKSFQNVLKRIANHFPKMGYTQGINFIVKYLIVIGYSQMDSYEIFTHLAINKRYLLLGLYQDGFPLYNIFIVLFENALKRLNGKLHQHLYQNLCIDPSMWICKWFMTFYVYSFPAELIKYIWDLVTLIGNLGIVTFAISLVQQLQPIILQILELSDLDAFLSSLRDIQGFNHHINLQRLLTKAYTIELVISDFDKVEQIHSFYGVIIKSQFKIDKISKKDNKQEVEGDLHQKIENMLNAWRNSLISDRIIFVTNHNNNKSTNLSILQLQIESVSKSIVNKDINQPLEDIPQLQLQQPPIDPPQSIKNDENYQNQQRAVPAPQKIQYSFNQIRQKVQEEDQSTKSKYVKKSKKSNTVDLDALDKLDFVEKIKKSINFSNSINRKNSTKPQRQQISQPKINSSYINESNSLSIAGHISLNKDQSFQNVSVLSKQPSNKSNSKNMSRLKLPNKNSRICGCKTKTQQNKLSNALPNNQKQQSKDQFSDKDSLSNRNFSHSQQHIDQVQSIQGMDTHRERVQSHNNYMINSHGPAILKDKERHAAQGKPEADIQVMVLQFKKNKKARVNLVFPSEKIPKEKQIKNEWSHEQQSIESINQIDRSSQVHSHCSQNGNQYEIESIR